MNARTASHKPDMSTLFAGRGMPMLPALQQVTAAVGTTLTQSICALVLRAWASECRRAERADRFVPYC